MCVCVCAIAIVVRPPSVRERKKALHCLHFFTHFFLVSQIGIYICLPFFQDSLFRRFFALKRRYQISVGSRQMASSNNSKSLLHPWELASVSSGLSIERKKEKAHLEGKKSSHLTAYASICHMHFINVHLFFASFFLFVHQQKWKSVFHSGKKGNKKRKTEYEIHYTVKYKKLIMKK